MKLYKKELLQKNYPNLVMAEESWRLTAGSNEMVGKDIFLHWDSLVPQSALPSRRRENLLREAQYFFSWHMVSSKKKLRPPGDRTIQLIFDTLRTAINWIVSMGVFSFGEVSGEDIASFFSYRTPVPKRRYFDQGLQKRSISSRQYLLKQLYLCYIETQVGFPFDPETFCNFREILGTALHSQYEPLPEPIAISLLSDAIAWIQGPAIKFIEAVEKCEEKKLELGGDALSSENDFRLIRKFINNEERLELASYLGVEASITTGHLLLLGRKETIAACLFIIFYMTGLRVGSVVELPGNCIRYYEHADGSQYPYLQGSITKGAKREAIWIANEIVVEAIAHLERISLRIRENSPKGYLLSSMKGPAVLHRRDIGYSRKGARDINDLLKYFALSARRSSVLPKTFRIHAHQGRKTFARFVGMRDKSALGALASYFGHVNRAVTDSSYIGNDLDLNAILDKENLNDLADGLTDILSAPHLGGNAGMYILEKNTLKRKFRGRAELRTVVNQMIANGVQLAPCNWGYCVYRQELSACRGDRHGPSTIARSPGVCSGCQNFCITPKHEQWWKDRLKASQDYLALKGVPEMTRSFVEKRVFECQNVLNSVQAAEKKNGKETVRHRDGKGKAHRSKIRA